MSTVTLQHATELYNYHTFSQFLSRAFAVTMSLESTQLRKNVIKFTRRLLILVSKCTPQFSILYYKYSLHHDRTRQRDDIYFQTTSAYHVTTQIVSKNGDIPEQMMFTEGFCIKWKTQELNQNIHNLICLFQYLKIQKMSHSNLTHLFTNIVYPYT